MAKSEHGPQGATKKEFQKAKGLLNQFLAANLHMEPNQTPTVVKGSTSDQYEYNSVSDGTVMAVATPVKSGV